MKNISVDIRKINDSGIGRYIRSLLPGIIDAMQDYHFNLLVDKNKVENFGWTQYKNLDIIHSTSNPYSIQEQIELYKKTPLDAALFWAPHYNIPIVSKTKLFVTVHDVLHLAHPEFFSGWHKRLYAHSMFRILKKQATQIVCVSEFTKKELTKYVGINPNRIKVIYNGLEPRWFNLKKGKKIYHKPYLFFVGNVKPHKNIGRMLEAFTLIKDSIPHDLIIIGQKEGFITKDTSSALVTEGDQNRVHFTGYVSEDKLNQYYLYADAMIFPSLYEGFGFPPLEAMASGCPVVASNAASIPEVCGEAALYFDPLNVKEIANKVILLLENKKLKEQLIKKGKKQAAQFSQKQCINATVNVLKSLVAN